MPLSWNEIKDRALRFSREWAGEASERAESQTFWNAFFDVFGLTRRRVASFEEPVKRLRDGGKTTTGKIDLFWKGVLLVEHKSQGKDLARAYTQAVDYFEGIAERDLPRYVLVSDFARFRLHDLDSGAEHDFDLKDLHRKVRLFGFIAGYQTRIYKDDDPVNVAAAEKMGALHDALEASGYEGHPLEVLLVRLLFCLFADDTGIFDRNAFRELVELRSSVDGSDLGRLLNELFEVLNTPAEKRQRALDEQLAAFPYVNGRLFEERLFTAAFDARTRSSLLDACALDWGQISPAIFGAMFQSVMDPKLRRNLGAHYTSEKNIQKLIGPLFLDELKADLARIRALKQTNVRQAQLRQFHQRLASLRFLDPACGCGNFLVVTYRELRALELEVLRELHADVTTRFLSVKDEIHVDVDQFYGIEIEEFPAQIAQVALWLVDHQMNQRVSEEFGELFVRLPLVKSATIVHANALRADWLDLCGGTAPSYVLGNPPFVGKKEQTVSQKADLAFALSGIDGAGVLDFVCGWYVKAIPLLKAGSIGAAFVSTNSICQGEQVGVLWPALFKHRVAITFAHRTFRWSNDARGVAAVHCVIVGFAIAGDLPPAKRLFEYETPVSEPHEVVAANINPYLVDAPDVVIGKRSQVLSSDVPEMRYGSMPIDSGHLVLDKAVADELVSECGEAASVVRLYVGGEEFLNGGIRFCLWFDGADTSLIRRCKGIADRVEQTRVFRRGSGRAATVALADTPYLFGEIRQPRSRYLLVPKVSSEARRFMPLGFLGPDVIASGSALLIPDASLWHFGILQASMHMAWMRYTCGRLESRYQYSAAIVYNNFPWPDAPTDATKAAIESAAQTVLDARAQFPGSSLADLYDPRTMPPVLVKAHQALDRAVDAAYLAGEAAAGRRKPSLKTDAERVAFLFTLYQHYTSLLPAPAAKPKRPRKPRTAAAASND
jgi:hypothetical protein